MPFRRIRIHTLRKLISAAIAVAMLFASLMPSLGMALAAKSRLSWVEICSAQGVKRVAVDASGAVVDDAASHADEGLGAPPAHSGEHCPFCHLQTALPEPDVGLPALYSVVMPTPVWQPALAVRLPEPLSAVRPFAIGPPRP